MKLTVIGSSAVLALVGVVSTASAQLDSVSYSDGDLLIGFRQSGASQDYVLDLGPYSTFLNATSAFEVSSITIQQSNPDGSPAGTASLGNINADLVTAFGSNYATNTSNPVLFAAFGWDGTSFALATKASGRWGSLTGADISQYGGNIDNIGGGSYEGNSSTNNSAVGLLQSTTTSNSYASYQPGGSASQGISFQVFNPTTEGAIQQSINLETFSPGSTPAIVGTLTVQPSGNGGNGDILYTPTPEPASAAMLVAGAAVLGLRRRRNA